MENHEGANSAYSRILKETLGIRTEPIAVKLIKESGQLPQDAIYPRRDLGSGMAICQAFALVRRERKTIYCDKTSERCWCPLVAFGLCECGEDSGAFEIMMSINRRNDREATKRFLDNLPKLPLGTCTGVLLSPLCSSAFEPDVTLIYCDNNSQLRGALLAIKNATGSVVKTQLDAIDSCAFSCVAVIKSGEYRVTIPDIGEHERANADECEIILSVPQGKLGELTNALLSLEKSGMGYANWKRIMDLDFQRPPFYDELFNFWGL